MKCQKCGISLIQGQAFCTQCGAPVPRSFQPNTEKQYFQVPEGFVRDPQSGLYYTSQTIFNSETGKNVQRVTYFNNETGVLQPVDYPLDNAIQMNPPRKSSKPKNQRIKVVIIAAFGGVLLSALMIVGFYTLLNSLTNSEETNFPPNGRESWEEYQRRGEDQPKTPEKKTEPEPETDQIKIVPYSTDDKNLETKELSDSTYTASTYEDEEYFYFLSPDRKEKELEIESKDKKEDFDIYDPESTPDEDEWEDEGQLEFLAEDNAPEENQEQVEEENPEESNTEQPETEEPFEAPFPEDFFQEEKETVLIKDSQGNAVYRMSKETGEVEAVITAKEGTIVHDFAIIGNQLFYQLGSVASNGEPDFTFYEVWGVHMDSGETRFITHSKDSPLGTDKGYLYLINHSDGFIEKYGIGRDSGKEDVPNSKKYDLDSKTSLHMSKFSLYDERTILPIYNYEENRQYTYVYHINSGEKEVVFKGQEDHLYRNTYVSPTMVFSVEFNGRTDELQTVTLGMTFRGVENAAEEFHALSTKEQVQWYDKGIFFHVIDDTIYYEKNGILVSAPLTEPTDIKELTSLTSEISSVVGSLIIFEDNSTYNLIEEEFSGFTPLNLKEPLLEKNVSFGRNPERRERAKFPAENVDYYNYNGEVQFFLENNDLIRLIGNGIPYLALEEEDSVVMYEVSMPLLYGMLRSGNLIGGINPDGSLNLEEMGRFCFDVFEVSLSPEDFKIQLKKSDYFIELENEVFVLNLEIVPDKIITGIEVHDVIIEEDGFTLSELAIYYLDSPVEIYTITGEKNTDPIISENVITSIALVEIVIP